MSESAAADRKPWLGSLCLALRALAAIWLAGVAIRVAGRAHSPVSGALFRAVGRSLGDDVDRHLRAGGFTD